jgi:hypothetical protein
VTSAPISPRPLCTKNGLATTEKCSAALLCQILSVTGPAQPPAVWVPQQLREILAATHAWSERAAESLEHLKSTLTDWTVRRDTVVT